MRLAAAVIDTNVVVSGILACAPKSPTVKILDGMLAGRFRFLLSVELLAEYAEVLSRRRIRRFHGLSEAEIDTVLTQIAANGVVIESMGTGGRKGPTARGACGLAMSTMRRPRANQVTGISVPVTVSHG